MGSCFKINLDGKTRFEDVNDVCLDSYTAGSQRSSFSQRDPEYGLLMGSLDFLKTRTVSQRYNNIIWNLSLYYYCSVVASKGKIKYQHIIFKGCGQDLTTQWDHTRFLRTMLTGLQYMTLISPHRNGQIQEPLPWPPIQEVWDGYMASWTTIKWSLHPHPVWLPYSLQIMLYGLILFGTFQRPLKDL